MPVKIDATTKKYVANNFVNKTGDTITGNLNITGKLQVQGTTETVNAVTYKIENNVIEFNPNKVNNETWLTGLAINKGLDGETDLGTYGIMYDPSTDAVKLGFGQVDEENKFKFNINESAPIATREEFNDEWEEDEIFVFDKATKKFKHSGKTFTSFEEEITAKIPEAVVNIAIISELDGKYDVILNASPVGMYPKTEACPVSDEIISGCTHVFDAVYNPVKTQLITKAETMGKVAVGGASMLVYQAVKAHEIWDGDFYSEEEINKIIKAVEDKINEGQVK
jgi:hypothetical protein